MATIYYPFRAVRYDRSVSLGAPFGRGCQDALSDPLRGDRDRHLAVVADSSKTIGISVVSRFTDSCRNVQTQIPIALRSHSTVASQPAVSSLEAYQTPTR